MSKHPLNQALRFLLEMVALFTFGVWGWQQLPGWQGLLLAIFLPLGFATLWGVFAVRNDPSRSGKTVVPTPGVLRLLLEISFFTLATLALFDLGKTNAGIVFLVLVVLHYAFSVDRIAWLTKQ